MHLTSDAFAFTLNGQDLEFAVQSGRLERQARLRRKGGKGFNLRGVEPPANASCGRDAEHPDSLLAVSHRRGEPDLIAGPQKAAEIVLRPRHDPHAHRLVAHQDARRGTGGPETKLPGRTIQGQQCPVHSQKQTGVLGDRGNRRVWIGLAGNGEAHVVDGPQDGISRLQDGVSTAEVARQAIDLAEGEPRTCPHHGGDDGDYQQSVEGERQEGIESRVAQSLDRADEEDGGDNEEPAADDSTTVGSAHPFEGHYAPA